MLRSLVVTFVVVAAAVIGPVVPTAAQHAPDVAMDTVAVAPPAAEQIYSAAGWTVSQAMATRPFAMVGIELSDEVEVQIRTARGDGPWSGWVDLPHQHDEGPDPTSEEARAAAAGERTHPVFTDAADRLQVRSSGGLHGLEAHLIDPFGLDRSVWQAMTDRAEAAWRGSPRAPAHALADTPAIVTRAQWGADESIVRGDPAYARSVERAFVHHTVGSNSYSQAQAPGVVRGVMAYHVNGNGWSDIGYNFLVDRFGTIYEGRRGGVDQAVIGAQAGGFNTFSTGVALMGTFTSASAGTAALDAVQRVIAWKADVHHFHPLQTSEATSLGSTRYPEGTVVTLNTISGHRDVSLTSCPGDVSYGELSAIRTGVRNRAGDLIVNHATDVTDTRVIRGDPDRESLTLSGELDPPGEWSLEVRAPDGTVMHRDSGSGSTASSTMPLAGDGWALGEYEWSLSSPGRRTAHESVAFRPPVITGLNTSTDLATADADGTLASPVAVHADLWEGASWTMTVIDPQGAEVHRVTGQGSDLDAGWFDGVAEPGTYRITVAAEDAADVSRSIEVRYDLLGRVGDATDPIGGAALISAATFGRGEARRAVIARHDVFADALSGGPLAGTEGPLLLTTGDSLDPRVTAELDRVLAPDATIYVLGGTAAIDESVLVGLAARYGHVVRLAGDSRFATAAVIAEAVVEDSGATTAMVARAGPDDAAPWADALAGGAHGARRGIPVLLSDAGELSAATQAALNDMDITDTIVLGGPAAVSADVMAALPDPVRLSGADRTGTAVAVAEQLWGDDVSEILLANGYGDTAWAWALAAAPMAAREGAPLLLTSAADLAPATSSYLGQAAQLAGGTIVGSRDLVSSEVGYAASDRIRR